MHTRSPIIPVILAGGAGTRLWPLSRQSHPKQFLNLGSEDKSLLQQTIERALVFSPPVIYIVTNKDYYFLCQAQLKDYSDTSIQYILEPFAKNTANAICSVAHLIEKTHPSAQLLVLSSDHYMNNMAVFKQAVLNANQFLNTTQTLITFGIHPTSAHTGYGYIESQSNNDTIIPIVRFHEKPSLEEATRYITLSNYYWNSGMFVLPVQFFLEEMKTHAPAVFDATYLAVQEKESHQDYHHLNKDRYQQCPNISIDYALFEKSACLHMIPLSLAWSDLGSWEAVYEISVKNDDNNAIIGHAVTDKTSDCYIHSEKILVSTIGVQHLRIIATDDAILIANKNEGERVKSLVQTLKQTQPELTETHRIVDRPWGQYEILAEGAHFKTKRIRVNPYAKLSLQKHQHRAEHWVVIEGEADIINDTISTRLKTNESTYIPKNTLHRLSNPTDKALVIIEVQTGDYLGEDDITRFDDMYERR